MILWYLLLRQNRPLQEETVSSDKRVVYRKTDCASEISSGERMFAGGEGIVLGHTPAKPQWSEVMIFWYLLLRQRSSLQEESVSFDERPARRKADLRRVAQFRGANAGRRRLNSGEAAVVGGDSFFGCAPPAEYPFTGGNCQLRRAVRSSEVGMCQRD